MEGIGFPGSIVTGVPAASIRPAAGSGRNFTNESDGYNYLGRGEDVIFVMVLG